nr:unnamed protein product [Callosobruchus analis]
MLKSVMRRLNVLEHRQKRYRRTPVYSSDDPGSDRASNNDDVGPELSSSEDELRATDAHETLQSTTISEWLFGTELENTIEVAKKLEKSGEQLKVRKNKPPGSTSASTPKQGNYRRPFAKGVQQMGHRFQRRTPPQSTNQKRTKSHRPYPTHRRNHSLERRRPY